MRGVTRFLVGGVILAALAVPPTLAAWLASSLAVLAGASPWFALLAGALVFPVVPLLWEAGSARTERRAWRLAWRTQVVGLVVVGGLLGAWPARSFTALAAHGDWWIPRERDDAAAAGGRAAARVAADALEGLYVLASKDPYREHHAPAPRPDIRPVAARVERAEGPSATGLTDQPAPGVERLCTVTEDGQRVCVEGARRTASADNDPLPSVSTPPPARQGTAPATATHPDPPEIALLKKVSSQFRKPQGTASSASPRWPMDMEVHPALLRMGTADEGSLDAVAAWLVERSRPGADRIKALHDWVATRIAYDVPAYLERNIPAQDPETVFKRRTAVCAGYSMLLAELGRRAGEDIVYVHGDSTGGLKGGFEAHAWNAARVEDGWVLMDVTWNAGAVMMGTTTFRPRYDTRFLFTPPDVFLQRHFPVDPAWQLLPEPLSRAEWQRLTVTGDGGAPLRVRR